MNEDQGRFSKYDEPGTYALGYTLTFVHDIGPVQLRQALLGHVQVGPVSLSVAREWARSQWDNPIGQAACATVQAAPGWSYVWEENGWQGIDNAAVEVSRLGALISVSWNVNGLITFLRARNGIIERTFEPMFREEQVGSPWGAVLTQERGLNWSIGNSRSAALALQYRFTGIEPDSIDTGLEAFGYVQP